jgi:hypothetical protein
VHNERVRPPLSRPALSLVVLTTASALALGGCSGGDGKGTDKTSGSSSASSTASPSPTTTVKVPHGTTLTDQGSKLSFGDPARVVFEPSAKRGSVLQLTVRSVQQGRLSDFKGFILDDAYKKKAAYYYAKVQVKNLGEGNVGGVAVPLWGVNDANTLLPAVNFTTSFKKCPSKPLPKKFGPGATLNTCLVYLSPNRGKLDAVSYRPSQEFNPITWTGTIAKPAAPTKQPKKAKKKG